MTTAEARRHGLYNVLTETIGVEEADTLMAYLPTQPHEVLATKADIESVRQDLGSRIDLLQTGLTSLESDLATLRGEMSGLWGEMSGEVTSLRTELSGRIDSVNRRLDRLFLTLAAGLLAVVGAVVVQAIL